MRNVLLFLRLVVVGEVRVEHEKAAVTAAVVAVVVVGRVGEENEQQHCNDHEAENRASSSHCIQDEFRCLLLVLFCFASFRFH